MDELKYKPAAVSRVTGVSQMILQNWERADRRHIKRESGGRLYTFRRALQIALMKKLVDLGVNPPAAAEASYSFTDIGDGPLPSRPPREPGEVFDNGWTLLCIYPGGISDVINVQPDGAALQLFMPMGFGRQEAVIALNVTFLADRLRQDLDGSDAEG